jgi:hypothetical protein
MEKRIFNIETRTEETEDGKTYKQAYEELEKEYMYHFKKRRYADYNSFRNCRDKRLKKANKLHI